MKTKTEKGRVVLAFSFSIPLSQNRCSQFLSHPPAAALNPSLPALNLSPSPRRKAVQSSAAAAPHSLFLFVSFESALINMYANCGAMEFAREIYEGLPLKNMIVLSAIYLQLRCCFILVNFVNVLLMCVLLIVMPKHVSLSTDKMSRIPSVVPQKRRKSSIENAFNVEDMNHLIENIAMVFYAGVLSFHLARNPYYVSSYSFAANHNLSGFLPLSYNALRTTLLKQERAHIDRLLQPIKSLWTLKGVTLVSNGWTDVQRRPLINFIGICEGGHIFLKVVDGSDEYKDKFYMTNIFNSRWADIEYAPDKISSKNLPRLSNIPGVATEND
ncbi:uncharacterized protein LOC123914506 isoform X1 [Trifolium pratense]|nr:uncharacterized protein LOC123914506 isoform X1 [Trifolium pratense]